MRILREIFGQAEFRQSSLLRLETRFLSNCLKYYNLYLDENGIFYKRLIRNDTLNGIFFALTALVPVIKIFKTTEEKP